MISLRRGAAQSNWRSQRDNSSRRPPVLNLVALMDVFTILVFFFLVHSTEGAPQAHAELVKLPESVADQPPRDAPVVIITLDKILLEGKLVVALGEGVTGPRGQIEALSSALADDALSQSEPGVAREITIMGHRSIPFELLNSVMRTCTKAGYANIALSVLQRSSGGGQ